ncbi:MAG: hypothetical protein U9O98_08695 [Asgard group archaeon]|nr:hypothetical protein [Asgard group archaeon]
MIHYVWIILNDIPIAGMRFIKISNAEERERLERFYGWLSGPIEQFTTKVQEIVIEGTKYYYHSNNGVLFVIGTDLDETAITSVFLPELESKFFDKFSKNAIDSFSPNNPDYFRSFDKDILSLVNAFKKRTTDAKSKRKSLDAFEVLNLPSELQRVALVLVKLQVVTPEMVSQVSGVLPDEVERQLNEIYQMGYLYLTKIANKRYYSIKPFGTEELKRVPVTQKTKEELRSMSLGVKESSEHITQESLATTSTRKKTAAKKQPVFDIDAATVKSDNSVKGKNDVIGTAMMPPPPTISSSESAKESHKISPKITESSLDDKSSIPPLQAEKDLPKDQFIADSSPAEAKLNEKQKSTFKADLVAKEIDKKHIMNISFSRNGRIPSNTLRREKNFNTGKIKIPNIKNRNPFLLFEIFKRNLDNLFEALFMGDFIVLLSESRDKTIENLVDELFAVFKLLTPHRNLRFEKTDTFIHPKDADVIFAPKQLKKYYSWATMIDIDQKKIISGSSSEFSKNTVKKLRKIAAPKEFMKEITKLSTILVNICRDINTLKIEGRKPDEYLSEVKKTYGMAVLNAALALSERLIRLHKDCAYIAGFYIRKGLDVIVRSIILQEPVVIIGNDPLDIFHVIEALAIFSPEKSVKSQIWITDYAGFELKDIVLIGAQEGTDKLFRGVVKVNLPSRSAVGGQRSKYVHSFLRKMWKHRSKQRPKFIRDVLSEISSLKRELIRELNSYSREELTKKRIRNIIQNYDEEFGPFFADLISDTYPELATKIKQSL